MYTTCQILRNSEVVNFVRTVIKTGYAAYFKDHAIDINNMVDDTLDRLTQSQQPSTNPDALCEVISQCLSDTFKKHDDTFWFNSIYHHYKTIIKPETDFQQLQDVITGRRVLDYGCGSGYLSVRLARGGYEVHGTDVLDYRYPEAQNIPFTKMDSPTDLNYSEDSIDTALVQAVLHHIDSNQLPLVIQQLARIAKYVVIKEDTYDLPPTLPGLSTVLKQQPLLQSFTEMATQTQFQVLLLIDFYANAIAQGIPEMHMPFAFRTVNEWIAILKENGLSVTRTIVSGFEPGRMHQTCHVWFVCERS